MYAYMYNYVHVNIILTFMVLFLGRRPMCSMISCG